MKTPTFQVLFRKRRTSALLAAIPLLLMPMHSYAAASRSIQMGLAGGIIFALLLTASIILIFVFQRRYSRTNHELQDITAELDITRNRLSETSHDLETSQRDLKATTNRYQGILFDAGVGMFQLDAEGRCIYVNNAMQELSGLYLKKAQSEGLSSAVHPDDRSRFEAAWEQFIGGDEPFNLPFRFRYKRGREVRDVHVSCRADRVINAKKEVESYIGWVSDVTHFHNLQMEEKSRTDRLKYFVDETVEGYFRLASETPLPTTSAAAKMADAIMEQMEMLECNDTFAAMYGAKPAEMQGKAIMDLQGGCGPFRNKQDLINFVENGYKSVNVESVKQDPSGSRLSLINDIVGIIEDNKLVGIWGSVRNISHQKREQAELSSQVQFMHRILNALPADVHVKDTRCRYLYASRKMADRTGIPQEDWIGKTIFEVMPGTSRDHDQQAIETMKSGKLKRAERPFEAKGKSGWMETVQIPLISDDGLVEGVIGLSLDITERKAKEEEIRGRFVSLENVLKKTRGDLNQVRDDYSRTTTALADAIQKLKVAEAEKINREHRYKEHLEERRRVEDSLRRSEESLQIRQRKLEEQLAARLAELEAETDKRKKWEELLSIKEEELQKAEVLAADLGRQLAESEDFLKSTQEQLIHITEQHTIEIDKEKSDRRKMTDELAAARQQLDEKDSRWKKELETVQTRLASQLEEEHAKRGNAESQLTRTEQLLQKTQEEIKQLTERHSKELEDEVAERKSAAEKLIQSMEELDELRQQFNVRLEQETKTIKQELAQKQIREKALRQHEKDLEERIKELETTLHLKSKEFAEQLQAREGAEVQKKQIEQRLEQMTKRQQELVARETQKLQLHIAEIRLQEVKLRKETGDLQREKESLEELLHARNNELQRAAEQQQRTESLLGETKSELKKLSDNQDQLIAAEAESLKQQLAEVQHQGELLHQQLETLQQEKKHLEDTLAARDAEIEKTGQDYQQAAAALKEREAALKQLGENQSRMIDDQTRELRKQVEQLQQQSEKLQQQHAKLQQEKEAVEANLESRTQDLGKAAREYRKVVDAFKNSQARIKELSENHEAALAEKSRELRDELEQLRTTESDLRAKSMKLEAHIEEQQKRMAEISNNLKHETEQRMQTAKDLQDLQSAVESDKENAEALIQEQTKALNTQIEQLQQTETMLKQELEAARQTVAERDDSLATMKTEREQIEARISEVEKRLAGIREEHKAELKKSMAEVKQISRLNGELVDELNNALQSALNPVVKTTILLEKADNISQDQREELTKANQNCRKLIDMMNYRCELTHLADGSDQMQTSRCDLHGLMTDIDRQFSHRAETKKLFFAVSFAQYQTAHNVPKHVETDELKIRKVLSILLGYAMEKTEKGRIGLHATRKSCSEDNANIAFELAYTGKEARDELLSAIFGNEQQENDVVDVKFGLTLARRYLGMLSGEYTLEYRSGGITAITLQFPFKKVASEMVVPENGEKKAGAA